MKYSIKSKLLIILGLIILMVAYIYISPGCVFRNITGIPCPSCGLTRASLYVLQFKFSDAFWYHPMVFSLPILVVLFFTEGKIFKNEKISIVILIILGILYIATYILRLIGFLNPLV